MNFLYLLRDQAKRAEAETAAAVLVGFTGVYPLVKLAAGLLLGTWALAEAVYDVKQLFAGEEVPLIKGSRDWKLSLSQAAEILTGKDRIAESTGNTSVEKEESLSLRWDYGGYLRMLCLLEPMKNQLFRMMDVIEMNLRQEDPGFFMENCLSYAGVETVFQTSPRFFRLPLAEGYVQRKYAGYGY